jgi:hypothetical protein
MDGRSIRARRSGAAPLLVLIKPRNSVFPSSFGVVAIGVRLTRLIGGVTDAKQVLPSIVTQSFVGTNGGTSLKYQAYRPFFAGTGGTAKHLRPRVQVVRRRDGGERL